MPDTNHQELLERFVSAATRAVATVEVIQATADAVNEALMNATAGDEHVLLAEPDDIDPALLAVFRTHPRVITAPSNEHYSTVPAGVTDAFAGIASTGSVCVSMSGHLTSPMSMLTRRHIVLVDGRSIVARPSDVFSEHMLDGKGMRRSFTFITGPSATADMGPLVRGVHGPGALHIIVMERPND